MLKYNKVPGQKIELEVVALCTLAPSSDGGKFPDEFAIVLLPPPFETAGGGVFPCAGGAGSAVIAGEGGTGGDCAVGV